MSLYLVLNKSQKEDHFGDQDSLIGRGAEKPAVCIRLRTILRQVVSLASRLSFRKSASFTLRLAAYPLLSMRWYGFVADFATRYDLGRPHDDIIRKAIPNFFIYKASLTERFNLLKNHYTVAGQKMSPQDLQLLWAGREVQYATITGKKDHYDLALRLSDHSGARHEGAFTLLLHRRSDRILLCMMSFIFKALPDGTATVAIGGLQGANGETAKRAVIDSTRDLHGVRPKDAMLLVAEGMATVGGADHVLAVDNDAHVINFRHQGRRTKMRCDLNSYWCERGGEAGGRFGFVLPHRNQQLSEATAKRDLSKQAFWLAGKALLSFETTLNPADGS